MTPDEASTIRDKKGRLLHGGPSSAAPPPTLKSQSSWKTTNIPAAAAKRRARRRTKASPATRDEILTSVPLALKPVTLSTREARAVLSIGNSLLWKLIASGELKTLRIASKRLVLAASIEDLVVRLLDKEAAKEENG
jgi:hypothetical protein